jgi:hypothetical protein
LIELTLLLGNDPLGTRAKNLMRLVTSGLGSRGLRAYFAALHLVVVFLLIFCL